MTYIYIKDFRTGLDGRKMPETSIPGTLLQLDDGHITRGGEIETRLALVSKYSLPAGDTFGMTQKQGQLYVFGSDAAPSVPAGVKYQRLQHPSALDMARVLDAKNFNNKIYAIAEYSNGTIFHFYDGTILANWVDGRSRGSFTITGGTENAGVAASTSFTITGGADGDTCTSVTVDSVEILGDTVDFLSTVGATADLIALQINAFQSDWVATTDTSGSPATSIVILTSATVGTAYNGLAATASESGSWSFSSPAVTAGGVDVSAITSVTVNSVEILDDTVPFDTDVETTAAAVAAQINEYVSDPNYSATSFGAVVNILALVDGTAANTFVINPTESGDVTTGSIVNMADGATDVLVINVPATRIKVAKNKVYAVAPNGVLYFCAINNPTAWLSGTGYGNINLSVNSEGSEDLVAVDTYYQYLADFAKEAAQIWSIDADPDFNALQQPLNTTGTLAADSVQAYGDNDVFFLGSDGYRSLRARDSSNAAAVSDVGTPVDDLVQARVREVTAGQVGRSTSVISPLGKRYISAIGEECFVFTFFSGSKISAWSKYIFADDVDKFTIIKNKLYVRIGDTIYLYGGDDDDDYTDVSCIVKTPFLDAENPVKIKQFRSINISCQGEWTVEACTDPNAEAVMGEETFTTIAVISRTTFGMSEIPFEHEANYVQLRLTSTAGSYARLGSIAIRYDGD